MQIKKTFIASTLAVLVLAPAASLAAESLLDEREIYGRSMESMKASLAEHGIDAVDVESWGTSLRVEVRDADGSRHTIMVDRDTLRPLGRNDVATRVDTDRPAGSGGPLRDAFENPTSLVE